MTNEQIARVCHEANRAYCAAHGDHSQVAWDDAPEWQRKSAIAGVTHALDFPRVTAESQHEAWCEAKRKEGWTYGPEKDPEKRTHPCLVPHAELDRYQQHKDELFLAVARSLAGLAVFEELKKL